MRTSAVIYVCVAALLLASSCQAARPRRHLSQAIATANAVAGPGETVVANSGATSEAGKPAVSVVNAQGAGSGTVVTCEQQAKSGQVLSKECGGAGGTWDTAPPCKNAPNTYTVTRGTGSDSRPWGYENDDKRSCALRGKDGKPLV